MFRKIPLGSVVPLTEFLSKALDRPFQQYDIEKLDFSLKTVEALRDQCFEYQRQFLPNIGLGKRAPHDRYVESRIYPEKPETELWPGIFNQRNIIKEESVGLEIFVRGDNLIPFIKKALLFCHGVFVEPPHFILPGRAFDEDDCVEHARQTVLDLAPVNTLISRKIVVPIDPSYDPGMVSGNVWSSFNKPLKLDQSTKKEISAIAKRLAGRNHGVKQQDAERAIIQALLDQNATKQRSGFFDPLFYDRLEAKAYGEILYHLNASITSKEKIQPILAQKLVSGFGISPDKVSARDLVAMRDDHELFHEWRQIISGALLHLSENEDDYRDSARELREYLADNQAKWTEQAEKAVGKGFLGQMIDGAQDVASHFVAGMVVGGLSGAQGGRWAGGVAASAVPLLKLFMKLPKSLPDGRKRALLRSHFLAIGAKL
ncbi:hypothetical protein ACLF3G_20095 [Falsiroseomonas sp. HC035]|uniref:hypothetical protein n=1 Tax=Falsiroseomonas sp. HC035 TaxID=3390999 RepID=UPI003D31E93C